MIEEVPNVHSKIILVDNNNNAIDITPFDTDSNRLIDKLKTNILAATKGNLLQSVPYVIDSSVERPTAPISTTSTTITTVEKTLKLARAVCIAKPYNPEFLSEFNQAFWFARQRRMGVSQGDLVVADCPYSETDLRKFDKKDFGLFVPQIVSTAPEGLINLGKAFIGMGFHFQERTGIKNIDQNGNQIDIHGWMKTEKTIKAPHTNTDQTQAEEILKKKHRLGLTLNIYAVASQQSNELTGKYLDEGRQTSTRILSSYRRGQIQSAYFVGDRSFGNCSVHDTRPYDADGRLGVRSVKVAKTKKEVFSN